MPKTELFAAIDVGSYEVSMKIFEMSAKKGVRELDHIRHRIDLGTDTYATGRIGRQHMQELVGILRDFREIMQGYGVTSYRACGTSALRETKNIDIVRNLLFRETGITVEVISNSEQRFLDYQSVALFGEEFARIIESPTGFLDIGGGSIQLSIFDNDKLVATQNIRLGVLRIAQMLAGLGAPLERFSSLIPEIASAQIGSFQKMYLQERGLRNLIIVDDYISPVLKKIRIGALENGYTTVRDLERFMRNCGSMPRLELAAMLQIPVENIPLVAITGRLITYIASELNCEMIWAPGVTLCDGIAYQSAEEKGVIKINHEFERDIIACAQNMAKRYMISRKRGEMLSRISCDIFDAMKKIHGLGKRERLLLQIACILNDCGRYVSMLNMAECSYHIIVSTEMIGISHREREIIANVVRYHHMAVEAISDRSQTRTAIDRDDFLVIAKLIAILRVANGLDRTHRQKFKNVKVRLKDEELLITVDTLVDITVENGMFGARATFFEEVYGIRPVIRQKRVRETEEA